MGRLDRRKQRVRKSAEPGQLDLDLNRASHRTRARAHVLHNHRQQRQSQFPAFFAPFFNLFFCHAALRDQRHLSLGKARNKRRQETKKVRPQTKIFIATQGRAAMSVVRWALTAPGCESEENKCTCGALGAYMDVRGLSHNMDGEGRHL